VSKREAYPKKSGLATENSTKFLFRWTPQRGSSGYVPGSASIYIRTFFILGTALFPKEDVRGIAATSSEANPRRYRRRSWSVPVVRQILNYSQYLQPIDSIRSPLRLNAFSKKRVACFLETCSASRSDRDKTDRMGLWSLFPKCSQTEWSPKHALYQ
jgi:hypothetical protein